MDQTSDIKTIYLVRHGRTEWNLKRKLQGRDDIPLSHLGEQDAIQLQQFFLNIPIQKIICSPLQRAKKTAQIINRNQLTIFEDKRLIEIDYGPFSGENVETYWSKIIGEQLVGIESRENITNRMISAFQELIQVKEQQILVVSHSVALGVLLNNLNVFSPQQRLGHHEIVALNLRNKYLVSWEKISL